MSPNSCHEDSSSNEDPDEKHTRHDSPPLIVPQPSLNLPSIPQPLSNHPVPSPDRLATSSNSPESRDLDVEDEHDTDAPENLSLKKPFTPGTPPPVQPTQNNQNGQNNSLHSQIHLQQAQNTPQTPPFIPYHHFAPQFPHAFQNQPSPVGAPPGLGAPGQYPLQRSPVDILLRVFPGRRRSDVEALLQR